MIILAYILGIITGIALVFAFAVRHILKTEEQYQKENDTYRKMLEDDIPDTWRYMEL